MNFTGSFLQFMEADITDELGHPISTIKKTGRKYPFNFDKPKVHYDILYGTKEPELIEMRNIPNLNDLGVVLHTIPVRKEEKWFSKQTKRLKLFLRDSIQKEGKEISYLPARTSFIYDKANGAIKIIGILAGPEGEGQWLKV
jgi:hypothetical protein